MSNVFSILRYNSLSFKRHFLYLSAFCLFFLLGEGCSTYQNVTGYFNTYYNAKKVFDDAVKEIENTPQKGRDSLYFIEVAISPTAEQKFDKVIEKCSKLIQFYDKSGWVDDAIVMIGISYVYKGESESAIRKFRELLDNFPDSDLRFQAKLWYAKAQYFMGKTEDALQLTVELFEEARSEGDDEVLFDLLMLEAQIAFERNDYNVASTKYTLASEVSVGDNLRSRAQYQLGVMYERQQDWEKAAEAYGKVKEFSPPASLDFQSRLKYGEMLTQSQQYDKALIVLDKIFEEPIKKEERSLVDLQIANTHWARGDSANAFALYTLIDTTYKRTDASAKSYYQRGTIYEKHFLDFKTAKEYYAKAKDEFAQSVITPLAQRKTVTFNNYFKHYQDIKKYDSLYALSLHLDSIKLVKDSAKVSFDSTSSKAVEFGDSLSTLQDKLIRTAVADTVSSVKTIAGLTDSLSQSIPPPPDEEFDEDEELAEGRRGDDVDTTKNITLLDSLTSKSVLPGKRIDSLIVKNVTKDTSKNKNKPVPPVQSVALSPDSIRSLLAQTKFDLGGIFLLELQLPDSALIVFNDIVRNYSTSRVMPRTLYAMAEIYRSKNDIVTVDSIYKVLISDYEKSEYAIHAKKLLGLAVDTTQLDPALHEYQKAEQLFLGQKTSDAILLLKSLVTKYPLSPYKPKAMYMLGWIHENIIMDNDSAARWYQQLVKEHPSSVYASTVQPKLAVKADPASLPQYVKIKEIQALQPVKAVKTSTRAAESNPQKETQDDDVQRGRRNRDRDPDEEEEEPEAPEEDDEKL